MAEYRAMNPDAAINRVVVLGSTLREKASGEAPVISGALEAWLREADQAPEDFAFVTLDSEPFSFGRQNRAHVIPADPGFDYRDHALRPRFNGCGQWQTLHPDAFAAHYPQDVMAEMLAAARLPMTNDPLDNLVRYIDQVMPGPEGERRVSERFRSVLTGFPAGTKVIFEGYRGIGLIGHLGPAMAETGVETILRIHEGVSREMPRFKWGREALHGLRYANRILVHSDAHAEELQDAFAQLKIFPHPVIERYDLGIDQERVRRSVATIKPENFHTAIPRFAGLSETQKALITEALTTRESVPHRFMCVDALDPVKGALVTAAAIKSFLEEETGRFGAAEVCGRYRFFLIQGARQSNFQLNEYEKPSLLHPYRERARAAIAELQEEYPGVVWCCEPLRGGPSLAIPALFVQCHSLSGAITEGLNLAVQEGLYANYLTPGAATGIILGRGAGFALQSIRNGSKDLGCFPQSGDAAAFESAMRDLTDLEETTPAVLRRRLESLVLREVLPRHASIFDL